MRDILKNPEKMVELLLDHSMQGLLYFYCANALLEASARSELMSRSWFFVVVSHAAMNEAILALSRLLKKHPRSVTIYDLLDVVEENPDLLDPTDPEKVTQSVANDRRRLEKHGALIQSVLERRDRAGAHIDKRHLTDPSGLFAYPQGVEISEFRECLLELVGILNSYLGYYNREIELSHFESMIAGDVEILLEWMREYGRPEQWIRPPEFGRSVEMRGE